MKEFFGNYRGKVLNIVDPDGTGRVKIEVYPMLLGIESARSLDGITGIPTANLPWSVPAYPLFAGSGANKGFFAVPELNSLVWVFFEAGDINQPVYFAEAPTKIQGVLNGEVYEVIWKSATLEIKINRNTGQIDITGNGDVNITIDGDANITAEGGVNVTAPNTKITGNVEVTGEVTAANFITNEVPDYNAHVHPGVESGGSSTAGPV